MGEHAAAAAHLAPARDITVPDDGADARAALGELSELRDLSLKLTEAVRALVVLSPLASVDIPESTDGARALKVSEALSLVADLRDQMRPLQTVIGNARGIRAATADPLPEVEAFTGQVKQVDVYRQLQSEVTTRAEAVATLQREVTAVTEALDTASHEVQGIIGDAGSCPICGHG
jgi:hypothetical protein